MGVRYFGASVRRLEDPKLLTGQGQYLDDLKVPGVLHAAFVRSAYAHSRITGIDTSAAQAVPGVIAVLTASDLEKLASGPLPEAAPAPIIKQVKVQRPLARDAVHYVGEAIVLVVATSRAIAEDAAALVVVDYDPRPVMADWRKALDAGAAVAHEGSPDNLIAQMAARFGDVEGVFASAPHTFRQQLTLHRGGCHAMECRGVLARPDPVGNRLDVWSATQAPYMVRRLLARYLGRHEASVRVAAPDVGGGFGPKAVVYPEDYVIPMAALLLGRPVKWVEDRREHFLATTQQRDQLWDLEVAADGSGRMLGVRGRCIHDNGAYLPYGLVLPATCIGSFPGPYALAALDIHLDVVFTNLVPNTPIRGAARPNTCFVLERLADRVALELGIAREEVRRQSFVRKDQFPYTTGMKSRDGSPASYDSGDFHGCLELALEKFGGDFRARQASARAEGRYLGLGFSSYIEDTGIGPFEGANVRVMPNGKVLLQTGAASQGQGHRTVFAQICADELGVTPEDVIVEAADTAAFPLGIGTVGSRIAVTGGSSVQMAASRVRGKALKVAALWLNVPEAELILEDGFVTRPGTNLKMPLGEIAGRLDGNPGMPTPLGLDPGLSAQAYYDAKSTTYAGGTNICELEVDIGTGDVRVLRYLVAHDCGRLINPMLVDGQIRGGVVHGIGNALYERMVYDEEGQPQTTNYGEYLMALAPEMPRIEIHHLETPSPLNPIGVKGAGEGGTIPATPCIISGIEDALRPFGVQIREHPIAPDRILALIEAGQASIAVSAEHQLR